VVRCTFSPARAWRPAGVAPLARTLGPTRRPNAHSHCNLWPLWPEDRVWPASPPKNPKTRSSIRRASLLPSQVRVQSSSGDSRAGAKQEPSSLKHALAVTTQGLTKTCRTRPTSSVHQRTAVAHAQRRCQRSKAKPPPQPRPLRFWRLHTGKVTQLLRQVGPNHSVKGSANGVPPGPGHRYAVHCLWPGPGVTPPSPPYLKR